MMSIEQINYNNKQNAKNASKSKKTPYVFFNQEEIDNTPPFPFPNIGDYRPKSWTLIEEILCDSSGWGADNELALTVDKLKKHLKVGIGYAIISEGQFQIYVGAFKKNG